MKIAVYDTYVTKRDGQTMHFDVLVPDGVSPDKVLEFAHRYLESVGQSGQPCGTQECQFCHAEQATPEVQDSIRSNGCHIIEMEGCR